ncbi:MAG TPA: M48 family metalloprotease [Crinalium sp.]|jgi:Zn-dependent protease with chaperone function
MDDLFRSSQFDASRTGNLASGEVPSLEAGVAAMKRKDYPTAIAHLSAVAQSPDKAIALKAQMALVVAYQRMGDIEGAIAYCQSLRNSSSKQVQAWAAQTLQSLQQPSVRSDEEHGLNAPSATDEEPDPTGFTPLTSNSRFESTSPINTRVEEDATGFVPLEPVSQSSSQPPSRESASPTFNAGSAGPSLPNVQGAASGTPIDIDEATPIAPESSDEPLASPIPDEVNSEGSGSDYTSNLIRTSPRPQRTSKITAPTARRTERPIPNELTWRQAGRAAKWTSLGPMDLAKLWALEAGTVVALILVIRVLFQGAIAALNQVFGRVMWPIDLREYVIYSDPFGLSLAIVVVLFLASPWLLDQILRRFYTAKSMRLDDLGSASPEAVRVIKRICGQKRYSTPAIRILPIPAPLAFTYGSLPQNARIAVSQGLLTKLSDDEIAAVLAGELGHIASWDFAVLSATTLVAQIPYLIYWTIADWGDGQRNSVLRAIAIILSSISYGLFVILHWVGLWLSRLRTYYSDRAAAEATGNPNGLTRALLKMAIGIDDAIQQQRRTSYLLESFDALMPLGYRSALAIGSAYPYSTFEALLEWDQTNPYRHGLAINDAHPPLGDRLQRLAHYAHQWRLEPELMLKPSAKSTGFLSGSSASRARFWLQSAPFVGAVLGFAIACLLWLLGNIATRMNWVGLAWMQGDQSILWGCVLTGFSLGTFLRINPFFTDITSRNLDVDPILSDLLVSADALPIDHQPVRLHGQLLGRPGIANVLNQDLILQSDTGLVKLHYRSRVGYLGDLLPQSPRPKDWVHHPVIVTGWFRRGATPWIDVDTIQSPQGRKMQSGHPIWSTLLASMAGLLAALIILQGGSL